MDFNTKTLAAQSIIDAHTAGRRLEEGNGPATDLYHVLDSLLTWCDFHRVDFDATLSELRSDLAEVPPCTVKAGAVALTLEKGRDVHVIQRFATIAETAAFLNTAPTINQADLIAGRYGIDAPHGVASDDEAVTLARRLGCIVSRSTWDDGAGGIGVSYFAILPDEDGRRPDDFESLEAAALDALSVIEP